MRLISDEIHSLINDAAKDCGLTFAERAPLRVALHRRIAAAWNRRSDAAVHAERDRAEAAERERDAQARLDAWQSDDTRIVYTCRRWNAVASAMLVSVQLAVVEADGEFFKPRTVASGIGPSLAEATDDAFKKLDTRYRLEASHV